MMATCEKVHGDFWRIRMALAVLVVLDVTLMRSMTAVKADSLCSGVIFGLGYACNEYTVQTSDGFLLGMYNIPYGVAGPSSAYRIPVLLMHGFQAGGDNWLLNSPQESLGTILADQGYDVWIGNNRDVQWSNGHVIYGYNDSGYWDWTWDELAAYDLVALINFVYTQRGNTPVSYVCHSQGCMTFFACLTGTPYATQVASQLRLAVLLAPFTHTGHITAPMQNLILSSYSDTILPFLGIGPVNAKALVDGICNQGRQSCDNLISGLTGPSSFLNDSRTPYYLNFFPQVTSSKNYNHYGQAKRSDLFQKYDKGPINNLLSYGQLEPPLYDLSTFPTSFPVQIFTGGIDGLADPVDTQWTLSNLPSGLNKEVLNFPNYGHLDFMIGYNAYVDIYPSVLSFLSSQ
ncbi:unnamed protein product [Calypogeia fissa]